MWPFKKLTRLGRYSREEQVALNQELGDLARQRPIGSALVAGIETLEVAAAKQPDVFAFAYSLCDAYMDAERYVEALHTAERMVEVWPTDPRAMYALATLYNTLGRERRRELSEEQLTRIDEHAALMALDSAQLPVGLRTGLSTPAIERACEQLDVPLKEVRRRAVEYLDKTLKLDMHRGDRPSVFTTLTLAQRSLARTPN